MSTVVLRVSPRLRNLRTATTSWRRGYNFASTQYDAAFNRDGVPEAGAEFCNKLRADTIAYLDQFDPKTWTNDPVTTLLRGEALTGGVLERTVDAFGCENGTVVQATPEQVDAVLEHLRSYAPPQRDNRTAVRAMEAEIFDVLGGSPWPAYLVGNQALDFKKQDGVTEIEESVQANVIEQRLSDQLLADEAAGAIAIGRAPAFVGCVSNFSNFLDLRRAELSAYVPAPPRCTYGPPAPASCVMYVPEAPGSSPRALHPPTPPALCVRGTRTGLGRVERAA